MFGPLGVPELLFILALALLIFGPRKLPEVGRTLGRGMSEFRKASNELRRTLNVEVAREEIRQHDPRRILREAIDEQARPAAKKPPRPDDPAPSESPGGTVAGDTVAGGTVAGGTVAGGTVARGTVARGTVARGTVAGDDDPPSEQPAS